MCVCFVVVVVSSKGAASSSTSASAQVSQILLGNKTPEEKAAMLVTFRAEAAKVEST